MTLRKRPERKTAQQQHSLDAALLLQAFHHAWEGALQGELITSANVLYAPREMLRAVLIASETAPSIEQELLGELALAGWRDAYEQRASFVEAVPPTEAIN
jgi:hypothetical protein